MSRGIISSDWRVCSAVKYDVYGRIVYEATGGYTSAARSAGGRS